MNSYLLFGLAFWLYACARYDWKNNKTPFMTKGLIKGFIFGVVFWPIAIPFYVLANRWKKKL